MEPGWRGGVIGELFNRSNSFLETSPQIIMRQSLRTYWPLAVVALWLTTHSGCANCQTWFGRSAAQAPTCVLEEDATAEQIVAKLNENSNKLRGWRSTSAQIRSTGNIMMPAVDAKIYVESPRNFRLVANGPVGGREVDLGSNVEHFWFWVRRNEAKEVIVASHDAPPEQLRRLQIPFQPDWIIETLGVVAQDPDENLSVQAGPEGSYQISIVADRVSPQGFKMTKVTTVDRRNGLPVEHALWDARGVMVARAKLTNYVREEKSTALVPSKIELDWPQANMHLTIKMSEIQVNPASFPKGTWVRPDFPGYEVIELSQR